MGKDPRPGLQVRMINGVTEHYILLALCCGSMYLLRDVDDIIGMGSAQ